MGRKKDEFWKYGTLLDTSKPHFICGFCHLTFSGGATRLKEHLAGGGQYHNIAACANVPQNIQEEACLALGEGKNQSLVYLYPPKL